MKPMLTAMVLGVLVATVLSLVLTWPFMWMWNFSVSPTVEGVRDLDYWRAFCLLWLLSLFFAGIVSRKGS